MLDCFGGHRRRLSFCRRRRRRLFLVRLALAQAGPECVDAFCHVTHQAWYATTPEDQQNDQEQNQQDNGICHIAKHELSSEFLMSAHHRSRAIIVP